MAALGFVGFCVALVPWYLFLQPADLMLLGASIMVLNNLLLRVIAPKSTKTAANAAKDRKLALERSKKDKRQVQYCQTHSYTIRCCMGIYLCTELCAAGVTGQEECEKGGA